MSEASNKIIDANSKTFYLISGTLNSTTFTEIFKDDKTMEDTHFLLETSAKHIYSYKLSNKATIWVIFYRITYHGNLESFVLEIKKFLNEVINFKGELRTPTITLNILKKLPEEYHKIAGKLSSNMKNLENPDAILNLLHNLALKEKGLSPQSTIQEISLNIEVFRAKTIHYFRDLKNNFLESHPDD
ncbi:hypothetical protein O181_069134 [Austropuccinia psidii MF-1]|uniref:Uncharacterized protein n=1 Tax=Austropuccinia psidii MF-1 TaxID=1389203 RepID=A0A9Q3I885_9BASI|nr:hypothetical protein [Austropuccinia psidii MF-1]